MNLAYVAVAISAVSIFGCSSLPRHATDSPTSGPYPASAEEAARVELSIPTGHSSSEWGGGFSLILDEHGFLPERDDDARGETSLGDVRSSDVVLAREQYDVVSRGWSPYSTTGSAQLFMDHDANRKASTTFVEQATSDLKMRAASLRADAVRSVRCFADKNRGYRLWCEGQARALTRATAVR